MIAVAQAMVVLSVLLNHLAAPEIRIILASLSSAIGALSLQNAVQKYRAERTDGFTPRGN